MKTEKIDEFDLEKITLRDLVKIDSDARENPEIKKSKPIISLDDFESEEKKKKNGILDGFLTPFKERFDELKKSWGILEPQEVKDFISYLSKYLTQQFNQAYEINYSSPEGKIVANIENKIWGKDDPNKIKLKEERNSLEQLSELGVDLEKLNNKINMMTIVNPFSSRNQLIPIKVMTKDGEKELVVNIKKYAQDAVKFNEKPENANAKIALIDIFKLFGKKDSPSLTPKEKESIDKLQKSATNTDKAGEDKLKDLMQKDEKNISETGLQSPKDSSWQERVKAFKAYNDNAHRR
jgi:hypothetical protein